MSPVTPPLSFPRPDALLFDMDGTLTEPRLDFPQMKIDMGIGPGPILESLAELNDFDRARAESVLHRHEENAAAESALNEGCRELLNFIQQSAWPTALITRNSRRSVETVLARHNLFFPVIVTREDGRHKPHPDPIHLACRQLNVTAVNAWMIGDGRYDIEAGLAAGTKTVWISHGRQPEFTAVPWQTVRNLFELTALLRKCL